MGEMVLQKIPARVGEMGEMVLQKIPARVGRWERWYYRRYRQG